VGVAPPGFEVRRRMSRVAFRVFPAGRAGDTRAYVCMHLVVVWVLSSGARK
jgi:hypothetical protein